MKVAISVNHAIHQQSHGEAFRKGFERHGITAEFTPGDVPIADADLHVTWSIKRPRIFDWRKQTGRHVLVAERGHVGDRMRLTSCGWNGLGRRGRYAKAMDGGARWQQWAHLMQPWKQGGSYALLIGQVPGDASLYGLTQGFPAWAQEQTDALRAMGYEVVFRPHPLSVKCGYRFCPTGARSRPGTLSEALADAALCITYNSTTGVESVLAGVPTVTLDEGAMAFDVAGHKLGEAVRPDRTAWSHDLAWTQFSLPEIASGFAWESLAPIMEAAA